MELYKQNDIKEEINKIIQNDDFDIIELKNVVLNFFNGLDEKFKEFVIKSLQDADYSDLDFYSGHNVVEMISAVCDSDVISYSDKRRILTVLSKTIADCSDDEDYCDGKIYVVTKNLSDDGSELVEEYNSWEEAEKDVDERYTSCCDDAYLAETVLFSILCSVKEREWDFTVNFCTVFEFNASGFEDGREPWEAANCEYDDCDDYDEESDE